MKDLIFAKYRLAFLGLFLGATIAVILILGLMLRGERIANNDLRTDLAKEQTGHRVTRASLDRATVALTSFMADADAARLAAQEAAARQRARDDDLGTQIAAIRSASAQRANSGGAAAEADCRTPDAVLNAKGL